MQNQADLLQIKIERAKALLPEETVNAIAAVDWRAAILELRAKRGYTFEQLWDLEIETELVLCGLVKPEDYPRELADRMKIGRREANEVVNEMNSLVFEKIKEEMIKNAERKKAFSKNEGVPANPPFPEYSLERGGNVSTLPRELATPEEGNKKEEAHPILIQKIAGPFKNPMVKTDYSLKNLQPSTPQNGTIPKKSIDPYRELPE